MLENPPDLSAANNSIPKRYVPPNQRNRRKSAGDHLHRSETPSTTTSRSVSDAESSRSSSHPPLIIALDGCCRSQAFLLLRQRWDAAINACHDPSLASSPERPVMYSSGSGGVQLPHHEVSGQMMEERERE